MSIHFMAQQKLLTIKIDKLRDVYPVWVQHQIEKFKEHLLKKLNLCGKNLKEKILLQKFCSCQNNWTMTTDVAFI